MTYLRTRGFHNGRPRLAPQHETNSQQGNMMAIWNLKNLGLVAFMVFGIDGCGTGAILFNERNGGPPSSTGAEAKQFDLDCKDVITPSADGSYKYKGEKVNYDEACTWENKTMPWKVLGYFHCAPLAHGKWDQYRKEVAAKATGKGCPGVAIRKTPPLVNDGGEAIGAYCVDPAQEN